MSAPATFSRLLGSTFVHRFDEVVLQIGDAALTRYDLVHSLDCAATARAAAILTKALRDLGATTTRAALALNPIDLATVPGVGVTAVYVFLCWQRTARGAKEVRDWAGTVTVATLKTRVRKRKAREGEPATRRRRGPRATQHHAA